MNNFNFNFHESFPPQTNYLAEVLKLAKENFGGTKEEISNITGIPTGNNSGKVVPHIKYLKYMNLINYNEKLGVFKLDLTDIGEVVFNNDPYIMENLTKVLIHYNLTKKTGARQWNYIFREYEYIFDSETSLKAMSNKGESIAGKDMKIGPLKSMYTSGDFENLGLFELDKDEIIFNEKYDSYELYNLYGYLLLKEWEDNFSDKDEITIDEVFDIIKWNKGLGFAYDTSIDILDELASIGVIKLNKQFNPITIIKNSNSRSLLNSLYENLI
ncbi:MAG: DUF4007 family protein [Sarcina sp.]